MSFQKILVPVDFSPASRHAIETALSLAQSYGASVDVVHISPRGVDYLPLDEHLFGKGGKQRSLTEEVRSAAQKAFDEFLGQLPETQRQRITTRLEAGVPWQTIKKLVDDEGFDLIVMGVHGRTGPQHVLLGSTTDRVLRRVSCPVLAVR